MAKRKITVTVDDELVDGQAHTFPGESLSGFVNTALRAEHDRRARRAALRVILDEWEASLGPADPATQAWAAAAFDAAAAPIAEHAA
jgi:hypothetical protein